MRPNIGVGVIVRNDGNVLLGKRKNAHGEGTWSFPGGHIEYGEDISECARRETREEAGIRVENVDIMTVTNDRFKETGDHYITLFVTADHAFGEPRVGEDESLVEWNWFSWDDLPEPLFLPIQNLLKQDIDPFT